MSRKSRITFHPDLTVEENAKINGVSVHGIYFYLKANQIDIKKKTTDGIVRELKKLIEVNPKITQRELARITGHSTATINKYLKEVKRKESPIKIELDRLIEIEHKNTENLKKNPKYYPTPTKQDLFKTNFKHYDTAHYLCVAFRRKGDLWKDLQIPFGNMNGGFPFEMNGVVFPTSEHAYISGIFSNNTPKHKELQERLLKIGSGYMAKRDIRAKNKDQWRKDWEEFNIDWMLYCVWQKVNQNEEFKNLLLTVPRKAMIIEDVSFQNQPKSGKDTSTVWGCRNQTKKAFGKLVGKYAKSMTFKTKKSEDEFINSYLWDYCNAGEYVGQNIMGKILTLIKNCLHEGMEPDIDYALLNSKKIYLLGKRIDFQ